MTELQAVFRSSNTSSPSAPITLEPESLSQAYEQVRERIAKVSEENLPHINLEIPATVSQVLGSLKQIRSLRAEITKLMPNFDIAEFDQLENYAYALAYVHTRWVFASNPPEILPELIQRATVLRDILVSQVSTLAKVRLIDGSVLDDLKGPVGHRNIALDMFGMAAILRENWSTVGSKVSITLAELEEADKLAKNIFHAISVREQAAGQQTELNRERQRAYKLLFETYSQARRAIGFVRWNEDDADRFAPSLFAGRGGQKRKVDAPAETAPAGTTVAAAPAPTTQSALPVGHPDSDPFTA